MRCEGKIALVTGGASGIGAATAQALTEYGAKVWIADHNIDAAQETAARLGTNALRLDVTQRADWTQATEEILARSGRLDILVNSAGISATGTPADVEGADLEAWRTIFAVNVEGTLLGCQAAISIMRKLGGSIVNVASTTAIHATPTLAAYGASKAAVHQLTKTVAVYCAQKGYAIRCNAVMPGMVNTPMTARLPDRNRDLWEAQIPVHRFGEPAEIAQAIAFLAGDAAPYINGEGLVIDGAFLARSGINP